MKSPSGLPTGADTGTSSVPRAVATSWPPPGHPLPLALRLVVVLVLVLLLAPTLPSPAAPDPGLEPPGFRPRGTGLHALTHARIIPRPGVVLTNATLVLSNGWIIAVSDSGGFASNTFLDGARIWDSTGLTLYPGFLDAYVPVSGESSPVPAATPVPVEDAHASAFANTDAGATATATASDVSDEGRFFGVPGNEQDPGHPGPGAPNRAVTPERRIGDLYSPDSKVNESLRSLGFTAAQIVPGRGIVRGQAAVVSLGDAGPNASVIRADSALCVALTASDTFPPRDQFPGSIMGTIALVRQTFLDAAHHAEDQAHFARHPAGRPRPRRDIALDALQAARTGQWVLFEPGSVLLADRAARIAPELGIVRRAFVASGQEWRRPDLMAATGGPFIVPVAFPTLPRFPDESAWDSVPLDLLRAWDWAPENPAVLRKAGLDIALTTHGLSERRNFRENLRQAIERGLHPDDALAALTRTPAGLCGLDSVLGTLEPGRWAHITVVDGDYFDPSSTVRGVWVDGVPFYPVTAPRPKSGTAAAAKPTPEPPPRVAKAPLEGRGPDLTPAAVLVRNATIWTSGPEGVLTHASLLVVDGRIQRVGHFTLPEPPPGNLHTIDGTGLHITPGIIDCHSHSMLFGGVNEATLPSTAMVRIADVVNSESPNIHLQLAGGVTTVQLLHGSANPIGGQSCVIKLRDGQGPDALRFAGAPAGIKFALGENVKQANWGERFNSRFPQTRMGVPTFIANRFEAARQYAASRQLAQSPPPPGSPPRPPVRQNLELDALAEILQGTRLIHCHSYRQDEILAFLRTMESFGVRVATLQHVLEGYKVADEIARHGAGASAFADWWAFKYEVIDAIPYAGSILHERQVLVSFNSDSSDHARRLPLEAAKAVKYGNTPEIEALRFVTLNPARQLRIDHRTGSLEPGKDADFALWSGHPLDSRSTCLQTWIDGHRYFDRSREPERARTLVEEHTKLVAKARGSARKNEASPAKPNPSGREQFFLRALEQARHLGIADCTDCRISERLTP